MTKHCLARIMVLVMFSLAFSLIAGLDVILSAQSEIADPAELGFDTNVLGEIDEVMSAAVADGDMVGCNAMVLKDGKVCYYRQWGQRNREEDVSVSRDTIWRIYSMTKPITSIAAMQLVEQGKLELDEPVSTYLPEFADQKVLEEKDGELKEVPANRQMTIRDLLRHSSGLTYGFFADSPADKKYVANGILINNPDLKSFSETLATLPLKHHPGSRFEYSVSTDLLGYVVESVSGQRFDEYLKANIFQPLKMNDTAFMVPEDNRDRFAEMYRPTRNGLKPSPRASSIRFLNEENRFFSGGGGLCSTIDDYKRFCLMLLNQGQLDDQRIINEESLKMMWTNQLEELQSSSRRFQFGLGFSISPEGDFAWGGAAGTRFWVNPEKNLAILFMVQINPYRAGFGRQMREIVYKALK